MLRASLVPGGDRGCLGARRRECRCRMKALLPGEAPGWGGAGRAMAALLLEFQGPQQAPLAGMQAPGAGAGKVALASWVLASSNLQERPLWRSSSSAGQCPPGPALEAQGQGLCSLASGQPWSWLPWGFYFTSSAGAEVREMGWRAGRKGQSEGLLLQPEDLRPPARAPRVAPDP